PRLLAIARFRADADDVHRRLRYAVQPEQFFPPAFGERNGPERGEVEEHGDQAKRLSEMARLDEDRPVPMARAIAPHGPREHGCHDDERGGAAEVRLMPEERRDVGAPKTRGQST